MKKITKALITGADGFIGSHLTELLLQEGIEVRALCQYNSFNSWGWLNNVRHPGLEIVCGDVRDKTFCNKITKGVDTVFHLAALIAIPYSYEAPQSYVDTNVSGTLNICQSCLYNSVSRLIVTSTSEVYGTAQFVPITESHPRQPQSPYSATKIAADALALSFYHSMDLPVVVARPFNTYGPRQSARAFIPTIITQIASGKKVIKVGDLRPTRDFNYVADTCRGFLSLAVADLQKVVGQDFNIATGKDVSMEETLKIIREILGKEVKIEVDEQRLRPENSEVFRLCGDNTKIKEATGWQPEISLHEGLKKTVEWFTQPDNLNNYKTDIYNR